MPFFLFPDIFGNKEGMLFLSPGSAGKFGKTGRFPCKNEEKCVKTNGKTRKNVGKYPQKVRKNVQKSV